jgi:ubiquinone/menaquinone biosynthesis C-methylase UbiE
MFQLARLNARVAGLALRGRWLGESQVAADYDRAAITYEEAWQRHLRPVTDELLTHVPGGVRGEIIDLGSGTGYVARRLAGTNPDARVTAVDISARMLAVAGEGAPGNMSCAVSDMINFLKSRNAGGAAMIVSTWALGYSNYPRLFRECSRVLKDSGTLAFIVNYADTLRPIFSAFAECMIRFPERVRLAAWPRFPKNRAALERALHGAGFGIQLFREGKVKIEPPATGLIVWLRETGILSGFDQMMDLSGPPAQLLESMVEKRRNDIHHHYAMAVAQRQPK